MAKTKEDERLLAVRINKELHRHFKTCAAMRGITIKELCASLMQKCVDETRSRASRENE